ncbi:MAG: hypothetical protein L6V93_08735 [Clostridiales bacterium]|nr:MAG: hypothetical protein L6V93_08735 [Clostridiales bacterium]
MNATATANMIASLIAERNYISPDQKNRLHRDLTCFCPKHCVFRKKRALSYLTTRLRLCSTLFNPGGSETTVQSTKSVMSALQGKEGGEIVEKRGRKKPY